MSKFKRVSELKTPDFMEKIADESYSGDPYAHLKQNKSARLNKIAQNNKNFKTSRVDSPQDWEKTPEPESYQDFTFPRDENDYKINPLGSNHNVIRKVSSSTDLDFTARDIESQLKFFTPEQYTNALMKGASIWSPDMNEISEAFGESQLSDSEAAFQTREARDIARQTKKDGWSKEAMKDVRQSKYSTARANPLLRTQNEMPYDQPFGVIDWSELDQQEQSRLRMRENRREASAKIKRKGASREEVHQSWEDDIDMNAPTMQSYYGQNGIDLNID